jgi:uncharacterized membrane protein YfcA
VSAVELAALALAAYVGGAAQSATGFGVVLPLAPLLFALEDPPDAVLTIAIAALAHNVLVLATRHRRLELRRRDAALLVAAALPGLVLGALIVASLPKPTMQVVVGATLLAAVGIRAHQPHRAQRINNAPAGAAVGLLSGTMTTTVAVNGPPLVIWLRARGATIVELRDTLAAVFLALNLTAIPSVAAQGGTTRVDTLAALGCGLVLGHLSGLAASTRLSTEVLERALVVLLLVAATSSIVAGLTAS